MYSCIKCNAAYPELGLPYRCKICGGVYDCDSIHFQPPTADFIKMPGFWRYRQSFDLPTNAPVISLGEGQTPLVWMDEFGYKIALKCEYQNPTGSFKDRGSATLVSFLCARGVERVVEDSSGNAGASLAAYAARAGILTQIYVPEYASGPKRRQIEAYGAEVIPVSGRRIDVTEEALLAVNGSEVYASHAYLPFNIPGYATIAYELVEQLGQAPGTFICPVGHGGLLLGVARGFTALKDAGLIDRYPKLIGVQAMACAPLAEMYTKHSHQIQRVVEGNTLAEGIRVANPLKSKEVVAAVLSSDGDFITVSEPKILSGRDELASRGFYVEMTSATVWDALEQAVNKDSNQRLPEPVVLVLTGSGLKTG